MQIIAKVIKAVPVQPENTEDTLCQIESLMPLVKHLGLLNAEHYLRRVLEQSGRKAKPDRLPAIGPDGFLDPKLKRLLKRVLAGDGPRCSQADYARILTIPELHNTLQLESALGADSRGGMILLGLNNMDDTRLAIQKLFARTDRVAEQ